VVDGDVAGERVLGLAVLAAQPAGVAHAREVLRLQVQGGSQNSISCFNRILNKNCSLPKQIYFSAIYVSEQANQEKR
jgi:hypothetical protein